MKPRIRGVWGVYILICRKISCRKKECEGPNGWAKGIKESLKKKSEGKSNILEDVMLPVQLQRAMAAEAEAAREARAKVIAAEGERDASESLKEAAKVIQRYPQALQVNTTNNLWSI